MRDHCFRGVQPLAVAMRTFDFMKQSLCLPRWLPPAVAQLRLDLKGGSVTLEGRSLKALKPTRSININQHGFT
jgi:hypothetical protein